MRVLVLHAQSGIRASTCVMWGVRWRARVCSGGGGPILRGGRRVRIRAYRDLRRLSPPTPEALRLQHLPYAVCASTLWEQRACFWTRRLGAARRRCASLEVLCERCAVHGAARSAAPEASTAARRRMRVRAIAGLKGERRRALRCACCYVRRPRPARRAGGIPGGFATRVSVNAV